MPQGPPGRLHRQPGDAWLECRCGTRHWGLHGAAGLLLVRRSDAGHEVVLQHRVSWSDQGGTWGIPGGALAPGEDPVAGAIREATEEAGIDPEHLEVASTHVLDHVDWAYTTVIARATGPQDPRPTDPESEAIAWVATDAVQDLPLHSAFADAWPRLRGAAERH
ncbi:NUDIX hydrolase [Isoptericola sp. b441]|uniref:NUDIX hydrolase n=1 Tax=Actinotalea lenta TaxID=3064654 RepID=A0ABT9D7S9_9CELL|nr:MULTISPECIES: NUDIX hydrolase [unclassified Isoptericola]MDO8106923.1 NUDIX hydrolase [Isoptericola sp. b441]MDO8121366.1 NUDIX hydrolase [Isoptericola sp. b490]